MPSARRVEVNFATGWFVESVISRRAHIKVYYPKCVGLFFKSAVAERRIRKPHDHSVSRLHTAAAALHPWRARRPVSRPAALYPPPVMPQDAAEITKRIFYKHVSF